MITSAQVKQLRERLGEKQTQFARRFGVYQSTVHRWEKKGVPGGTAEVAIWNLLKELDNKAKPAPSPQARQSAGVNP